jgi:hypothetical protein
MRGPVNLPGLRFFGRASFRDAKRPRARPQRPPIFFPAPLLTQPPGRLIGAGVRSIFRAATGVSVFAKRQSKSTIAAGTRSDDGLIA